MFMKGSTQPTMHMFLSVQGHLKGSGKKNKNKPLICKEMATSSRLEYTLLETEAYWGEKI